MPAARTNPADSLTQYNRPAPPSKTMQPHIAQRLAGSLDAVTDSLGDLAQLLDESKLFTTL